MKRTRLLAAALLGIAVACASGCSSTQDDARTSTTSEGRRAVRRVTLELVFEQGRFSPERALDILVSAPIDVALSRMPGCSGKVDHTTERWVYRCPDGAEFAGGPWNSRAVPYDELARPVEFTVDGAIGEPFEVQIVGLGMGGCRQLIGRADGELTGDVVRVDQWSMSGWDTCEPLAGTAGPSVAAPVPPRRVE